MIDAASIREIISVYEKHGWSLRRVLVSPGLADALGADLDGIFGDAPRFPSDTDAAWFARETRNDGTAWEIRHLDPSPFALLVVVGDDPEAVDKALQATEQQLREAVRRRPLSH